MAFVLSRFRSQSTLHHPIPKIMHSFCNFVSRLRFEDMLLQPSRKIRIPKSFWQQTHKSATCGRDLQRKLRGHKNCTPRSIACTLSVMNQPSTSPRHLRNDLNRHRRRILCSVQPFDAQCLSRSQKRTDTIHRTSQEREPHQCCKQKSREVRDPATAWLLQRVAESGDSTPNER